MLQCVDKFLQNAADHTLVGLVLVSIVITVAALSH
jgi:hypothetical protein